jgi:cytochrome c biogenesis protein CcmG, thiol:disulfide interchange protein DsbE
VETAVRRRAIWRGLAIGAVLSACVIAALVVFGGNDEEPATLGAIPTASGETGDTAPAEAFDRFDGTEATFADYRGTPLVVNFFASWCAPCVREMPAFEAAYQEIGDQVAFLGMNNQDRAADGEAIAEKTGVTYDLARDPDGDFLSAFGGIVMPTTVFIDAEGTVVEVHNGALSQSALEDRLSDLFGT